jgi:hypothetical protein
MSYFTSIEHVNGMYVSVVVNANNNSPIFRSRPYQDQTQAINEANSFLTSNAAPSPQPVVNSASYTTPSTVQQPVRRCCGR